MQGQTLPEQYYCILNYKTNLLQEFSVHATRWKCSGVVQIPSTEHRLHSPGELREQALKLQLLSIWKSFYCELSRTLMPTPLFFQIHIMVFIISHLRYESWQNLIPEIASWKTDIFSDSKHRGSQKQGSRHSLSQQHCLGKQMWLWGIFYSWYPGKPWCYIPVFWFAWYFPSVAMEWIGWVCHMNQRKHKNCNQSKHGKWKKIRKTLPGEVRLCLYHIIEEHGSLWSKARVSAVTMLLCNIHLDFQMDLQSRLTALESPRLMLRGRKGTSH